MNAIRQLLVRPVIIIIIMAVLGTVVTPLAGGSEPQDSEDRRIEELEARLEAQAELIRRLEERLLALEGDEAVPPPRSADSTASTEAPAPGAPGTPDEDEVVAILAEPPDEAEGGEDDYGLGDVRETHRVLSGTELESEEFPGSWAISGTDIRLKIGGYIKADAVFDFDGTLDKTQFLMRTIPVEGTPEFGGDPYVSLFAKETRFGFDLRRIKNDAPPLRAFLEGDFFSDGDDFRLRHAYMSAGNWLAGKTWTTLSYLESLPFMIDFAAGDALFGGRETQLRYTRSLDNGWTVVAALENLSLLGIENPNNLPGKATTQFPLLAARGEYRWDSGVLFIGSSIAQLHWDGGRDGPNDDAIQLDVVFGGRQRLGDRTYATWNIGYGEGAGENIMAFAGTNANAVLEADGKLNTFPALSVVLGAGHDWTDEWSSNISYAYGWLDTPDSRAPLALKRGGIGHVNLIWQPIERFSTGVEFMWGAQRVQNDAKGDASRLQLMSKFSF